MLKKKTMEIELSFGKSIFGSLRVIETHWVPLDFTKFKGPRVVYNPLKNESFMP